MRKESLKTMELDGRRVDYRLIRSEAARKLRVRVGLSGIEVVHPARRNQHELEAFLATHQEWICRQLERIEKMKQIRKPSRKTGPEILFSGTLTPITIELSQEKRTNRIALTDGIITICNGAYSPTEPSASLENWLRRQARERIHILLEDLEKKIGRRPGKIYIMGQRTKWGNCSWRQNLSFNWRLIMAPDYVIRYLVTHEVVHLEVPDHSKRFWLTVQSICPEMERARQWLSANSHKLMVDLDGLFAHKYLLTK